MQRLQQQFADRPFTILAVNVKESPGMKGKFPNKAKVDFTLLRDGDGQTTQDWQVSAYPTSFLVDMKGEVRYVAHDARKWDAPDMVRVIEAMMAGDSNP